MSLLDSARQGAKRLRISSPLLV